MNTTTARRREQRFRQADRMTFMVRISRESAGGGLVICKRAFLWNQRHKRRRRRRLSFGSFRMHASVIMITQNFRNFRLFIHVRFTAWRHVVGGGACRAICIMVILRFIEFNRDGCLSLGGTIFSANVGLCLVWYPENYIHYPRYLLH